ncbi:unnamed protein product [Closterium sp. NIES-53]
MLPSSNHIPIFPHYTPPLSTPPLSSSPLSSSPLSSSSLSFLHTLLPLSCTYPCTSYYLRRTLPYPSPYPSPYPAIFMTRTPHSLSVP